MSYYPRGGHGGGGEGDVEFDEYDSTPYSGGYDIGLTYGHALPPSDDICYPPSTSDSVADEDERRPSYSSEPSAYAQDALDNEYRSYSRPRPRPQYGYGYGPTPPGPPPQYGMPPPPYSPPPPYGPPPPGMPPPGEEYRSREYYDYQEPRHHHKKQHDGDDSSDSDDSDEEKKQRRYDRRHRHHHGGYDD